MNKQSIAGLVGALLAFVGAIFFFTNLGKPSNASLQFNPVEAIETIAFTVGFGMGIPTALAFLTGVAVIVLITVAGFYIGRKLYITFTA